MNVFFFKLFDLVRQQNPDFRNKLEAVEGDLLLSELGLSSANQKKIIEDVDIVIHSAATVRFDEPIK